MFLYRNLLYLLNLNKQTMATLTEKEWTVQVNEKLKVNFFAELRNSIVTEIYAIVELDGFHVTWSPLHKHGMIRIYEISKLTYDWIRLLSLVGNQRFKMEASIKEFLNTNLTYNN